MTVCVIGQDYSVSKIRYMLPNMEIYNDEISAHRLLTEIQWNISIVESIGAKISLLFIENHFIRLYPVKRGSRGVAHAAISLRWSVK